MVCYECGENARKARAVEANRWHYKRPCGMRIDKSQQCSPRLYIRTSASLPFRETSIFRGTRISTKTYLQKPNDIVVDLAFVIPILFNFCGLCVSSRSSGYALEEKDLPRLQTFSMTPKWIAYVDGYFLVQRLRYNDALSFLASESSRCDRQRRARARVILKKHRSKQLAIVYYYDGVHIHTE